MNTKEIVQGIREFQKTLDGIVEYFEGRDRDAAEQGQEGITNDTPWMDEAEKYVGLDEIDHNAELQSLLGVDPEDTPWCAAFVNGVLENVGIDGSGSNRARDFANWGEECECKRGAIAVFRSHVGFVDDNDKLLGGNQGNMVKHSNLKWYHDNMDFLGYRFPVV